MTALHLDFESRSTVDLRKTGVHVYACHPQTEVLCAGYAIDHEPGKMWTRDTDPSDIKHALEHADTIVAHNAQFERVLIAGVMARRHGWPKPPMSKWRCTMVRALAMSLPGSLENAAAAVGMETGKDTSGRALMLQMCKPRKPRKGEDPNGLYWFEDAARLDRLYDYCGQDVVVERVLDGRLLELRPDELALWRLDQTINDRGVQVDYDLCQAALKIVDQATAWLNAEIKEISNGDIGAFTNVTGIMRFCRVQGFQMDAMDKDTIDDALARTDVPPVVRRVLEIRREAAKASVTKIKALLNGRNKDGRARGLLQFHAAGTGRWAGRRFQPQNIKRPDLENVDAAIESVATGSAELVRMLYGEPLAVVGDCLRGMVCAAPGNTLYAADFSNIEGRVAAWSGDEGWKLDSFRAYDAGTGPDVYKLAVSGLFSIPVEAVTKEQRQKIGKVQELAGQYEGGVGAYLKFGIAEAFKILVPTVKDSASGDEWDGTWDRYRPKDPFSYGLAQDEWTATRIVIDRWRRRHPGIVECWHELADASMQAARHPGQVFRACHDRAIFRRAGSFLFMRLPSGRCIVYPYPSIKEREMPWKDNDGHPVYREQLSYRGPLPNRPGKWGDCYAHGGMLFNNWVQGISRDIEAEAMQRVEAADYWNVLNVHDEVVSETKEDFGSVEQFEQLMSVLPAWAGGLPLAAEGWCGKRYRK